MTILVDEFYPDEFRTETFNLAATWPAIADNANLILTAARPIIIDRIALWSTAVRSAETGTLDLRNLAAADAITAGTLILAMDALTLTSVGENAFDLTALSEETRTIVAGNRLALDTSNVAVTAGTLANMALSISYRTKVA